MKYEKKRQPFSYKFLNKRSWAEPGKGIQTEPGLIITFNKQGKAPFIVDTEEVATEYGKVYE